MKEIYIDLVIQIERLHRLFLEVVRKDLENFGTPDINNVQALIVYNIGKSQLSVGELSNRGYYLGSNASYNLKKLQQNKYIVQTRSPHDGRSTYIALSEKGLSLYENLCEAFDSQTGNLAKYLSNPKMQDLKNLLSSLEGFWNQTLRL